MRLLPGLKLVASFLKFQLVEEVKAGVKFRHAQPYLTGRYFGLRAFGEIYSSAFAAFALAGALGPLIMGTGFDRTGSYRGPLVAFVAATLLAATLLSRLGAYRYQPISHFAE